MTRVRIQYSIIFVSDMNRSIAFYRDVVGIPVKFESPGWSEFLTEGATLALHLGEAPSEAGLRPGDEVPGQCRAGFQVPDLEGFHRRMIEQGVPCLQEPTATFGVSIAQYADPDGLPFSVSEMPPNS